MIAHREMGIRRFVVPILLVLVYIITTRLFIWSTQCIYEYIPRTENLNCLVFRLLKDPIQMIGVSLLRYENSGILSVFTFEHLYALLLSLCLIVMMSLVEIAALMGAIVLLFGYILVYTLQVMFVVVSILLMIPNNLYDDLVSTWYKNQ